MYGQDSLVILDDYMEIRSLNHLEAILSFMDFNGFYTLASILSYSSHKREPKGYDKEHKHYMMDVGYDVPRIYESIYTNYKAQSIISLKWRATKIPPEGRGINWDGQLVCLMNHPYIYIWWQ